MAFITSADAEFTLTIPGVFAGPVVLQGYAVDDAFDTPNVKPAETKIGVDGHKSAGFIPYLVPMKVHLMADSPAIAIFEQWRDAMKAGRTPFPATEGSIWAPGLGKAWAFSDGTLTESSGGPPNAKKLFEAQEFEITWADVQVSNV